jgi:hypothetical protein
MRGTLPYVFPSHQCDTCNCGEGGKSLTRGARPQSERSGPSHSLEFRRLALGLIQGSTRPTPLGTEVSPRNDFRLVPRLMDFRESRWTILRTRLNV